MTTRTPAEQAAIDLALSKLNAYGDGFPATALVTLREAKADGFSKEGFPDAAVLVLLTPMLNWLSTLSGETVLELVNDEVVMGWFEGDGDDPETEDDDGEFMSTPSVTEDPSHIAEDYEDAFSHIARDHFLLIA